MTDSPASLLNPYDLDVLRSIQSLRERKEKATINSVQEHMVIRRSARERNEFAESLIAGLTLLFFAAGAKNMGCRLNRFHETFHSATAPPRDDYTANAIALLEHGEFIGILSGKDGTPDNYYVTQRGLSILNNQDPDEPEPTDIVIHW